MSRSQQRGRGGEPLAKADFREAMSRLAMAVHIVASDGPAGRFGLTASSVCSVTDTPATVLVCINRSSAVEEAVRANGVFCVNTLRADQTDLAEMFAGRGGLDMDERFARAGWSVLATGAPVLDEVLVALDCHVAEMREVGSHSVVFGRVEAVRLGSSQPALVYRGRDYRSV